MGSLTRQESVGHGEMSAPVGGGNKDKAAIPHLAEEAVEHGCVGDVGHKEFVEAQHAHVSHELRRDV